MSEEKKTTAENKVTKSVGKPEKKEIQQDCMMTGLSDYGFWSQKVKEEREARKEPDPSFRRGRIWC
jgi:cyanobactin cluster PatC/TenC/TruC protein